MALALADSKLKMTVSEYIKIVNKNETEEENIIFFQVCKQFSIDLYKKEQKTETDDLKQKMKSTKQESKKHSKTGSQPRNWEHFNTMQEIFSITVIKLLKKIETIFEENTNQSSSVVI